MPGLDTYRAQARNKENWSGYSRDKKRYRQLVDDLMNLQHRLCGYCENDLQNNHRQVEHVVPKSDPQEGKRRELDAANLVACCLGGTLATADGPGQYLDPTKDNTSCGQKKGNDMIPDFVDPRTLPELPSLTRVGPDGRIEVDKDACHIAGWAVDGVGETVEFLGLNVERLRLAREELWRALEKYWKDYHDDEDIMREAAREELLPDSSGGLSRFFTTRRSYFAAWGGEEVLAEEPRDWI